ncbi:MAG: dicarboxylate/amino acid:cation symporter [Treponema sp.]|nr:dicarboxylate/amino acid:cation symporter [Treponema sp.]
MKVWIKYLIGSVLGCLCAFLIPFDEAVTNNALFFIAEIVIRIGRYAVVPLVSTTAALAVFKLVQAKLFWRTALWTGIVLVASALLLTFIGINAILIVKLPRIPITADTATTSVTLGLSDGVRALFPYSSFETLGNGTFLCAALLFSGIIGAVLATDDATFRPIITLIDVLSKLFYTIACVIMEILSIGMIAIMCCWTVQFRVVIASGIFVPLIVLLTIVLLIVAVIVYPLITYILCHEPKPYRILYAGITPLLVAFFSGDANFTLPYIIRHGKESIGIRRRSNGSVIPFLSICARSGSALVAVVSFVIIWRSYSDLPMPFSTLLWLLSLSFLFSFVLGNVPTGGAFTVVSVLCALYGRGFEAGYLLLRPALLILNSFAAAFDALTVLYGSYIVGIKTRLVIRHTIPHFI